MLVSFTGHFYNQMMHFLGHESTFVQSHDNFDMEMLRNKLEICINNTKLNTCTSTLHGSLAHTFL